MTGDRRKHIAEQDDIANSTNPGDGPNDWNSLQQEHSISNDRSNGGDAGLGDADIVPPEAGDDDFTEFLNITRSTSSLPATDWQKQPGIMQSPNVEELPALGPLWYDSGPTQRVGPSDCTTGPTRSGHSHDHTRSGSSSQVAQPLANSSNATTSSDNMEFSPMDDIFQNPTNSRKALHPEGYLPPRYGNSANTRRDSANCCVAIDVKAQQRQQADVHCDCLPHCHVKVSGHLVLAPS